MTGSALLMRVLQEHRRWLVPLGIAALVNVGVFALVVYPLSLKVGASERRAATSRQQLAAVERDERATKTTVGRAAQADTDLRQFYTEMLPDSVEAARRMTYARLAELADDNGLVIERRSYDLDIAHRGRLKKLKISMALVGEYTDIRAFIHDLETAPEFIVIEDLALTEGGQPGAPLSVVVQLATYFSESRNGV